MSFLGLGVEKQVGDYILNEAIVEGSNSQVFQATHIPTGEKVAIKILNKIKMNSQPELKKKSEREMSILKKMFHKNIIKLFEIMETSQRLYIVTEFCEGGDLYNYISTRGHLSERQSCKFFHEIIEALSYLHSQQIAHRDIKPENFLLDTSGKSISLKLIDFGISSNYKGNLLETSCGTSAFAAPEMYVGGKYNPLFCDVWSSGIVLYAMMFGYLPFGDENEINNIKNIVSGDYEIPEEASDDLRDLLTHIIEVEPNKRYNLEQIKNHKWYNSVKVDSLPGLNVDKYKIPVDQRIVSVCEAYGFESDKITESVSENYYDNNTSIYYIILNKFIRERYDSVSDMFSQDFLDYINDPINLIDENSKKNKRDNENIENDVEKEKRKENKSNKQNNKNKKIKEVIYEDKSNEDDNNNDKSNDEGNENFDDLYEDKSNNENEDNNNDNEDLYEEKSNHEDDDNKDNNYDNIYEDKNDNKEKEKKDNNKFENYNENINKKDMNKNGDKYKENENDNNRVKIKDEKNEEEEKENENRNKKEKPKVERKNNNVFSFNFENSFYEDDNKSDNSDDKNKNDDKNITEDNHPNEKENINQNESNIKNDKKNKNNNEVNDSTEDFQMNPISESDQNNNLRNSNNLSNFNCTGVQKNDGLSSSYSDVTPKDNYENNNNSDKANNLVKEKPKLKVEISNNASIFIKSQINTLNNLKEIINKNKYKKNAPRNHKKKYKNNKTDSKKNIGKKNIYKYNSNKLNNSNKPDNNYISKEKLAKNTKVKKHTIIHNRNPSASNRKARNNIVYFDNDNNIRINYRNYSNDKQRNLKRKNITYNKPGMSKTNEIYKKKRPLQKFKNTSKTESKYIDENKTDNQNDNNIIPKNSNEKNRVIKHRQFNNYSIDLNNISYKEKKYKDFKIKNNTNNNDRTIMNYASYIKTYQKNYTKVPTKASNDKSENVVRRLLSNSKDKSTSKKKHEKTISMYSNPGKTNYNFESPDIKKSDYRNMILKSGGNKSFTYYNKNTNDKDKIKRFYQDSLKRNNPKLNYNSLLNNLNNNDYLSTNRSYLTSERNRTISKSKSRKRTHNKSFDINISKEEKQTILKNINKEWEKELFGFKIKNNYWPRPYKGPVNIKSILYSNRLEEIIREIITFLNKSEIRFKRDKTQFKFYCNKNEKFFDMEIFSFDNKNIKSNTLFYFSYITKTQYILGLKKYLDELNKILLQKFNLKNYINK